MIKSVSYYFVLVLLNVPVQVKSETCFGTSQYGRCSTNSACGCLHVIGTSDNGICGFLYRSCSEFVSCKFPSKLCYAPNHICVDHPRCHSHPVCYPVSTIDQQVCPPIITDSCVGNATVAGSSTGSPGSTAQLLFYPQGVYVDSARDIYVADFTNSRIQKWAPGASSGTTVAGSSTGLSGSTAELLKNPQGVHGDSSGNIYIADTLNNRIQKWASGASSGITVAGSPTGLSGTTAELLNRPSGVYVDSDGNLFVADWGNNRIQKWASGASSGTTVAGSPTGAFGSLAELLNNPFGLYVDSSGNIYVADTYKNRIQKWAPGASSGITVAGSSTGLSGSTAQLLNRPHGVYVDSAGNIYIADSGNHRIQKWVSGASSGTTVAGNSTGSRTGVLHFPVSVYLDAAGNMYVAEMEYHCIQRFCA